MRHSLVSLILLSCLLACGNVSAADSTSDSPAKANSTPAASGQPAGAIDPSASTSSAKPKKIDLNQATLEELATLPGVGTATAKAIIQGRPYHKVNELTNVSGIGPSKFATLKSRVTVKPQKVAKPSSSGQTVHKPSGSPSATSGATPETKAASGGQSAVGTANVPHSSGGKVNLNTASKEELDALPGIGPTKAQAIIDARPFSSIEDVMKVKGIKEGTFSKIRDQITVQ